MLNKLVVLLVMVTIITSCGGKKNKNGGGEDKLQPAEGYYMDGDKKVKIYYGGIFRINEVEKFKNLFPHAMIDAVSARITSNVYQGLYKFNQLTLEPELCLAEDVQVNDDATEWTLTIRKGVYFHDNPCFSDGKGRELTAEDVKYCFDKLCTAYQDNTNAELFTTRIKGAQSYFDQSKNGNPPAGGVSGIEVINGNQIKITLENPFSSFNSLLAHNACYIFPKEAYDKYGSDMRAKAVGTGPFYLDKVQEGTQVMLKKNKNYWETDENGNKLPYLDIVKITFTKDKKSELANFRKSNLDMVWKLPVDEMQEVLVDISDAQKGENPEFKYQQKNGLSTQFYAFNSNSEKFKDVRVRKAINYAIDRESLVTYTLKGEGLPAENGLIPKMGTYDNSKVEGYSFDPEKAKKLMAEAGFPGGKGFPSVTLYLNEGGSTNTIAANAIYNDLKDNLGIEIEIEALPFDVLIERFSTGQTELTRTSWIADYPDPSNFLWLFYGANVPEDPTAKSLPNFSRYQNPLFDEYFEKGMAALSTEDRNTYYRKCDSILIADAAFVPLYHDQYIRLVQNNVVGFPINAMEFRDLTRVFKTKD